MLHMKNTFWSMIAAGASLSHASDAVVRTVALSGSPAPAVPGVFFDLLSDPRLSEAGEVLYWSRLRGSGVSSGSDGSLWLERAGTTTLLLREGDASPTAAGDFLTGIPTASWDDSGGIALSAAFNVSGGGTQTTRLAAIRRTADGIVSSRVAEAVGSATLPALIPLSDTGEGVLWNPASRNNSILFLEDSTRVFDSTTPVPGAGGGHIPGGSAFRQISTPSLSSSGRVIFRAAAGTTNTTTDWVYGLFSDRAGSLGLLFAAGQQVPGAPEGQIFSEFANEPSIDGSGDFAFWARLEGAGSPSDADTALFISRAGEPLQVMARAGAAAPGTTLASFSGFSRRIALSESGSAAFIGFLTGGGVSNATNSGIWIWKPELMSSVLLAREGHPAPGVPGAVFTAFDGLWIGRGGHIAFTASIGGPGGISLGGLFCTDRSGAVRLITRTGAGFDIPGLSHRIVSAVSFDHSEAGQSRLNSSGELVCKVSFTDGTHGLFIASLPCFGDFNGDGAIDGLDISAFWTAWETGDTAADCTLDGSVDGADVERFFSRWEAGEC